MLSAKTVESSMTNRYARPAQMGNGGVVSLRLLSDPLQDDADDSLLHGDRGASWKVKNNESQPVTATD